MNMTLYISNAVHLSEAHIHTHKKVDNQTFTKKVENSCLCSSET